VWDVPSYCQYISGFAANYLGFDQCLPPTPTQIAETTLSNMGAAAANNPAVAQKIQEYADKSPTDPFYCQADPEACAAYKVATNSPGCSSIFGTGQLGQFACGNGTNPLGVPNYWLFIAVGGVILLLLIRR
jgi:hypothetical protein